MTFLNKLFILSFVSITLKVSFIEKTCQNLVNVYAFYGGNTLEACYKNLKCMCYIFC
jgi:hypothetical protein